MLLILDGSWRRDPFHTQTLDTHVAGQDGQQRYDEPSEEQPHGNPGHDPVRQPQTISDVHVAARHRRSSGIGRTRVVDHHWRDVAGDVTTSASAEQERGHHHAVADVHQEGEGLAALGAAHQSIGCLVSGHHGVGVVDLGEVR